MKEFVRRQAQSLHGRLAAEIERSSRDPDEESIHDLRVSIRRLTECLRSFRGFFPKRQARKSRKRLREVMSACSEIRDRDIALTLCDGARIPVGSPLRQWLQDARRGAELRLAAVLAEWREGKLANVGQRLNLEPKEDTDAEAPPVV